MDADVIKVYLAAAWHRKAEIATIAKQLEALGTVEITSRWLFEPPIPHARAAKTKFLRDRALMDRSDIRRCDVLVRFSDDMKREVAPIRELTGARLVETGLALAWGISVIAVGGIQPVFDYLPEVVHLPDVPALIGYFSPEEQDINDIVYFH